MCKVCSRVLNKEQWERCVDDKRELIISNPNVLESLVTYDDSWIFCYDPETKRQTAQWKYFDSPRPKKVRQTRCLVPQVDLRVHLLDRDEHRHPYIPDLPLCDFWMFLKLKDRLRGCHFDNVKEMKEAVLYTFTLEDYKGAFKKWLEH
ncbi:hypothetical protein Pcinc_041307 [Petrolisthes cinctipes]|uniref:Uncharacterized protein n=1 Tax=Petrolisthes cinctipes TaxID=88211 RepID=A0AAE1BJT8_PETCI|nr:hypothetical protein Pcinc_041307 [Petrolisthes cinctipes]